MADLGVGVGDHKREPALGEVIAHRQPGLTPSNDQDVDPLGNDRVVDCHVRESSGSLLKLDTKWR